MAKIGVPGGTPRYFEFLVDSGADYSLIPYSYAAVIGLAYKDIPSPEISVTLANNTNFTVKKADIVFILEGEEFLIPAFISQCEGECLLGRKGIFNAFDICIEEENEKCVFMRKGTTEITA